MIGTRLPGAARKIAGTITRTTMGFLQPPLASPRVPRDACSALIWGGSGLDRTRPSFPLSGPGLYVPLP